MSSLPLEVHEVLEQEYLSMYGPLDDDKTPPEDRRPTADYSASQILDADLAMRILTSCGVPIDAKAQEPLIEALNDVVGGGQPEVARLRDSRYMSDQGRLLVDEYERHAPPAGEARKELNRRLVDDALGDTVKPLRDLRLGHVYKRLHARPESDARSALCISGGGIRSATFALGVIQGLARAGILDKFDYVSTVSGGGYIGSWLSSWARRHPDSMTGVQDDLVRADSAVSGKVSTEVPRTKIEPEPAPVRHLREYSNYLSPKLGITSADTWTMASLYIRNLLLNLLVIVPILGAVLAMPRVFAYFLALSNHRDAWGLLITTLATVGIGFGYLGLARPVQRSNPSYQSSSSWSADTTFLLGCVFPLLISAVSLSLFWARVNEGGYRVSQTMAWTGFGGAFLLMTLVPAALFYIRYFRASKVARTQSVHRRATSSHFWKRLGFELLGTVAGVLTTFALLFLVAKELFPDPLQPVPTTAYLPPFLHPLFNSIPWAEVYVCLSVPIIMAIFYVQASIFVGLSGKVNEDHDREWWGRGGAWLLMCAVGLLVVSLIAVFGPVALYQAPIILGSIGGVSGLLAGILGFSSSTPANAKQKEEAGPAAKASNIGLTLAVPLFVVLLLATISLGTTWLIQKLDEGAFTVADGWAFAAQFTSNATVTGDVTVGGMKVSARNVTPAAAAVTLPTLKSIAHLQNVHATTATQLAIIFVVAVVAVGLSFCIGVNKFSMQALYRNRLIRAYLGASRYARNPDRFTGFDEEDNLQMFELRPELLWGSHIIQGRKFVEELASQPDVLTKLDEATQEAVKAGNLSGEGMRNLIQAINALLIQPSFDLSKHAPAWAKDLLPAMRNRAALDALFKTTLRPMVPPRDVAPAAAAAGAEAKLLVKKTASAVETKPLTHPRSPMHIINVALNLTSGDKLAWQQRQAESFTVSPYHAGSLFLGYRDAHEYGGPDGISIGTAVTISGAAASPNMGYHSSPLMAFLLAVFNIRLGSWLGNPGPVGENAYRKAHPRSNLKPLFDEVIGSSNSRYPWVYLSDGGHFENLGLYEMILRRCHFIVVSDAGADPKCAFEDLGNAIRKIRTDLGIPIDIDRVEMMPRKPDGSLEKGRYVATAKIRYSAMEPGARDGNLIYLKPGLYEGECFPRDVFNYARESKDFPHESTADQFFSESQFESYRALGRHVISEICGWYPARVAHAYSTVSAFFTQVFTKYPPNSSTDAGFVVPAAKSAPPPPPPQGPEISTVS